MWDPYRLDPIISDTFFSCHLPGKLLFLIGLRKTGRKTPLWNRDILKNKWQIFVLSLRMPGRREGGGDQRVPGRRWGEPLISARVLWMLPVLVLAKARCCIYRCRGGMYKTNSLGLCCIAWSVTSHECHGLCHADWQLGRKLGPYVPSQQPCWDSPAERSNGAGTGQIHAISLITLVFCSLPRYWFV